MSTLMELIGARLVRTISGFRTPCVLPSVFCVASSLCIRSFDSDAWGRAWMRRFGLRLQPQLILRLPAPQLPRTTRGLLVECVRVRRSSFLGNLGLARWDTPCKTPKLGMIGFVDECKHALPPRIAVSNFWFLVTSTIAA